jgi:hypothetical protein
MTASNFKLEYSQGSSNYAWQALSILKEYTALSCKERKAIHEFRAEVT